MITQSSIFDLAETHTVDPRPDESHYDGPVFSQSILPMKTVEEHIETAMEGASEQWKAHALEMVHKLASDRSSFTVDDIVHEGKTSALGGILRQAAEKGWIKKGIPVKSQRAESHGRLVYTWDSLIFTDF